MLYTIRGEGENYKAFTNGVITLTESGECSWKPSTSKKQGYIQKKRDKDLIAQELETLMMGDVMEVDDTPPSPPINRSKVNSALGTQINWGVASDVTPCSWVVGYNAYLNDQKIYRFAVENSIFWIQEKCQNTTWPVLTAMELKAVWLVWLIEGIK